VGVVHVLLIYRNVQSARKTTKLNHIPSEDRGYKLTNVPCGTWNLITNNTMEGNTMDSTTTVTPIYLQSRQTKLGLAVVTIKAEGDLFETSVVITEGSTDFKAEGIFSDVREAFCWAYGVKQIRNDRYADYQRQENNLVESKPSKGHIAEVISVQNALIESQQNYDNFSLARSSKIDTDKVSLKSLTTSPLLTAEDKSILAGLLAKMGKVIHD